MGIYESELKCGCKSISTTYDKNDPTHITKVCDLHKLEINKEFKYNLEGFKKRHKAKSIRKSYFKVKIVDIKTNTKDLKLVKMEVEDLDISKLENSTKIYFSEFGEEDIEGSSFENIDGKSVIIDVFKTEFIDRS